MKMKFIRSLVFVTVLITVLSLLSVTSFAYFCCPSYSEPEATKVVVYVGQLGAETYEQSLNGVLFTEEQIGIMADRILWTEGEIGTMADRIVYVAEISQDNSLIAIYEASDIVWKMSDDMWNAYGLTLTEVSSLPEGWSN